ncbi:hypothetical protein SpCBS45565_g01339 [Spizellomyces sp. 'palustris']|nr:hypothetical protein SpCBS45565_g01339 [Spizellomyces sp. 'palustris']
MFIEQKKRGPKKGSGRRAKSVASLLTDDEKDDVEEIKDVYPSPVEKEEDAGCFGLFSPAVDNAHGAFLEAETVAMDTLGWDMSGWGLQETSFAFDLAPGAEPFLATISTSTATAAPTRTPQPTSTETVISPNPPLLFLQPMNLTIPELPTIPSSLYLHLIAAFFTHFHPILPVFYEQSFFERLVPVNCHSDALLNAIYAIGTRYSTHALLSTAPFSSPAQASEYFADRASMALHKSSFTMLKKDAKKPAVSSSCELDDLVAKMLLCAWKAGCHRDVGFEGLYDIWTSAQKLKCMYEEGDRTMECQRAWWALLILDTVSGLASGLDPVVDETRYAATFAVDHVKDGGEANWPMYLPGLDTASFITPSSDVRFLLYLHILIRQITRSHQTLSPISVAHSSLLSYYDSLPSYFKFLDNVELSVLGVHIALGFCMALALLHSRDEGETSTYLLPHTSCKPSLECVLWAYKTQTSLLARWGSKWVIPSCQVFLLPSLGRLLRNGYANALTGVEPMEGVNPLEDGILRILDEVAEVWPGVSVAGARVRSVIEGLRGSIFG